MSSPPEDPNAAQHEAILGLLKRYQTALEKKDLPLLKQLWPGLGGVTEKQVRANFGFARTLRVELNPTSWRIDGDAAVVVCGRRDQLTSGDGREVEHSTTATFTLRRVSGSWLIDGIR